MEEAKSIGTNETAEKPCSGVDRLAEANLPTEFGQFKIIGFRGRETGEDFVAMVKGELSPDRASLVRIHSQCLTGDVFQSVKCDCGPQLHYALRKIEKEGHGVIIYQMQEGRGIGIINKIRAYALQDSGQDTVEANLSLGFEADLRSYECCAEIFKQLGLRKVRLMSNNPDKIAAVKASGLEVVERVSIEVQARDTFINYMKTKKKKMGHILEKITTE
jgi:3,4-dihydroxy 2-butanone 4-phosphate synthase / GTP cyclohydrolase II